MISPSESIPTLINSFSNSISGISTNSFPGNGISISVSFEQETNNIDVNSNTLIVNCNFFILISIICMLL